MTEVPLYKQPGISLGRRVADLLRRMTTEEKIAQLHAVVLDRRLLRDPVTGRLKDRETLDFCKRGIGRLSTSFVRFDPAASARIARRLQDGMRANRLGIPLLIDGEGLHGCRAAGSTHFPQAIGLAATWNPRLLERIAAAIGRECRARGIHQVLSPVLDVARDARAGRTEETYGEDPYLVARLGVAYVRGVQSQKVVATPKHFAANFAGDGGRDSHALHLSERLLREVYLPPYEAAFREAGALSVMSAYHSLDGVPCTANRWLMTDLLRKEWGFQGVAISDGGSVFMVQEYHQTASSLREAARQALSAGVDVEIPQARCFLYLPELVASGAVSMESLDAAVRRVLYVKFWCGLFDRPRVSPRSATAVNQCSAHRTLAWEAARQSITLLKNDGLLPLRRRVRRIAVIGPNAAVARLGGYSAVCPGASTPLEGLRRLLGDEGVRYAEGCPLRERSRRGFTAARAVARGADAVVMVMGNASPETEGEGNDRCCLDLPGVQEDLILEIAKVNPRVIVVLAGGSAVTLRRWIDHAGAIVQAWYPGQEGGAALADILCGRAVPGGKLPITFPKTTGQCPLYYNAKPSGRTHDYNDLRGVQAQFPFGHGLSYTRFEYSGLRVRESGRGSKKRLHVSARIRNTGRRAGDEVVQLYLRHEDSRRSRPLQELKGFRRLSLKRGQSAAVRFTLGPEELSCLDDKLRPVLEPGNIVVMLGSSSADIRLQTGTRRVMRADARYVISALQPAIPDIRTAPRPRKNLAFAPAGMYFSGRRTVARFGDLHREKEGLLYVRAALTMPYAGRGHLVYGADGPVKVWLHDRPLDCRPGAAPPLHPPMFRKAVRWRRGANHILFALQTGVGLAYGITLRGYVDTPRKLSRA